MDITREHSAYLMSNTEVQMACVYGGTIPLAEVCEPYFGLTYVEAARRAAVHDLPVPAFRLRASQKAPLVIRTREFAAWVDSSAEAALAEWEKSQA